MKLCNETITVFNKRWDDELGEEVYWPTVIEGASWHATQAETVDPKGGLVMANKAIIRIPEAAAGGYVDSIAYREADDPTGKWTLEGGTIIVKGAIEDTSSGAGAPPSPQGEGFWTPARLKEAFADCVTVLGVTDNRRAPNGKHFKVVGS